MSFQQRVVLSDDVEMTGWRYAPCSHQPAVRLPPPGPFQGSSEAIIISSDEEVDAPPAKRQKTTYRQLPLASSSDIKPNKSGTETDPNRRRPGPAPFIDLTIYDEVSVQGIQPRRKGVKRPKPPQNDTKDNPIVVLDSDEELPLRDNELESNSEYENMHGGYEIGWLMSAAGLDENIPGIDVDFVGEAVAKLSLDQIKPCLVTHSHGPPQTGLESFQEPKLAFSGFNNHSLSRRRHGPLRTSYSGGRARTGLLKHRPPGIQSPLTRLYLLTQFRMADACHSLSQSSTKLLLASSTPGGTMDGEMDGSKSFYRMGRCYACKYSPVFTVDPYNSHETLAIWTEETREKWLPAHYVNSNDPGIAGGPFQRKFYDVKCARFDPMNPNIFVSTGLDGTLTVWSSLSYIQKGPHPTFDSETAGRQVEEHYEPVKKWGKETYHGHSCHDIIYRPQNATNRISFFAAPCDNGSILVHSYPPTCDSFAVLPLKVSTNPVCKPGATVWGHESTSNELFVCIEAETNYAAFHTAWDLGRGRFLYYLDDHRSGEEIAVDPQGNTLALFTAWQHGLHLRLYDVRRQDGRHTAATTLPPASQQLQRDVPPEVRTVAWSPDGILLAVGGNDDVAHVYDVRCLGRGPVLSLTHKTRSSHYGITALSWTAETCFRSPTFGLLTGGGDHCIALWDIKTACTERQVVAELNGQVGLASFGDPSRGEKPLVAADADGRIYVYDFVERELE